MFGIKSLNKYSASTLESPSRDLFPEMAQCVDRVLCPKRFIIVLFFFSSGLIEMELTYSTV